MSLSITRAALLGASALALVGMSGPAMADGLKLELLGSYATGQFDASAAEIVSYDPASERLFVTNSGTNAVDILDLNGGSPTLISSIALGGGGPNSVAVKNGIVAIAQEAAVKTDPGTIEFYDTAGNFLNSVAVGALPDMVTFTPDGSRVLVAGEGEPGGGNNPLGTVSIVDISGGVGTAAVTTADFSAFNGQAAALAAAGANFAPGTTVAEDAEPEYIAVSEDGTKAFVSLQEINAIGVVDIAGGTVTDVFALGTKDHSIAANGIDPSNRDGAINIHAVPVQGLYQPDAIASYEVGGVNYIVTANEGDARDGEDIRIKDVTLDPVAFPDAAALQDDAELGRLNIISTLGDTDSDGDYDELFSYGGRSFSIFDETGNLVFDSGDAFEQLLAAILPDEFNATNDENDSFDSRSDDKGPEPEALILADIAGQTLAFIGLERVGGIMVYDITDPFAPNFLTYQTDRDFGLSDADLAAGLGTGLGPEGFDFVQAGESSLGVPLLLVANEVSGTTDVYAVNVPEPAVAGVVGAGLFGLALIRRLLQT